MSDDDGEVTKLTVIERLEEQLNTKDAEVAKLKAQVAEAEEEKLDREWRWARHRESPEAEGLPVPRLEIRWRPDHAEGWTWVAEYNLVYMHLLTHVVKVPLGSTTVNGFRKDTKPEHEGQVQLPWRDGVHIRSDMKHLNLPGFAICGTIVNVIEADPHETHVPRR